MNQGIKKPAPVMLTGLRFLEEGFRGSLKISLDLRLQKFSRSDPLKTLWQFPTFDFVGPDKKVLRGEGSAEQTRELQRRSVAALSESLAQRDGMTYCAQGVVQRLFTPLQGYYPEVRLDAFAPRARGTSSVAYEELV